MLRPCCEKICGILLTCDNKGVRSLLYIIHSYPNIQDTLTIREIKIRIFQARNILLNHFNCSYIVISHPMASFDIVTSMNKLIFPRVIILGSTFHHHHYIMTVLCLFCFAFVLSTRCMIPLGSYGALPSDKFSQRKHDKDSYVNVFFF